MNIITLKNFFNVMKKNYINKNYKLVFKKINDFEYSIIEYGKYEYEIINMDIRRNKININGKFYSPRCERILRDLLHEEKEVRFNKSNFLGFKFNGHSYGVESIGVSAPASKNKKEEARNNFIRAISGSQKLNLCEIYEILQYNNEIGTGCNNIHTSGVYPEDVEEILIQFSKLLEFGKLDF